ncbi:hypothetical protein SARC_06113 [Sphaeroforma arctica JP610]|uniref:Fatty acyl-CoA reductase n=1 Tax=Sphaeroforma arctica JP610 TaxID=667725 RepID=A0A0L0FY87_9EUKA|nr:hypothetical protein SARC_06113 [Sphaeroforma arctica JP610]KNC81579.1 hypothetical protein SARC_06113 [Sphaeroforma arctica JP610]|eukprot:XP_014155481.1 hypothetical protein SARC_06113 [Sphaeroforma arctica JP610]
MQPIKDVLRGDILLTGVTGFVGVVTLAKLLRHAPHSRVFVLVRPGNKIGARTRFETVCEQNGILFMGLDIARVHVVSGDMTACDKISAEDVATLHNVTTAIHCAASTEWRSPLPELLKINVHGAVALFTFCLTHLPKLRSYVHTSTSYSYVV